MTNWQGWVKKLLIINNVLAVLALLATASLFIVFKLYFPNVYYNIDTVESAFLTQSDPQDLISYRDNIQRLQAETDYQDQQSVAAAWEKLLGLTVPVEYLELHQDLVKVHAELKTGQTAQAQADLSKLAQQYGWLKTF